MGLRALLFLPLQEAGEPAAGMAEAESDSG
jgi:hypothetical protein